MSGARAGGDAVGSRDRDEGETSSPGFRLGTSHDGLWRVSC